MNAYPARIALDADRAATRVRLETLDAELADLAAAALGSNLDDEHDPEGATLAFERAQLIAVREQAGRHLDEIDAALARVSAGTHGRCEACGAPIAPQRLAARPAARRCLACADVRR